MPFQIVRNDITRMRVDAIVNAANRTLLGGGGVDGAIHRAAGPELLEACRKLGGCEPGEAKITRGYRLPCRWVIHTVGPVWQGGTCGEAELLARCCRASLALALQKKCASVAFPLISSGAFGYPKEQALEIVTREIGAFLEEHEMEVYLVVFDRESFCLSRARMSDIRAYIDENYVLAHPDMRRRGQETAEAMPAQMMLADLAAPQASNAPSPAAQKKRRKAAETGALPSLAERLSHLDESFSEMLLRKIDERGMTDAQCYKRANIDRKLFSKIRSSKLYRPSKPTALAFAVALELSLSETEELLRKAGYALSHSSRFDVIVEYFIVNGIYDVYQINEALFSFDQSLLGS